MKTKFKLFLEDYVNPEYSWFEAIENGDIDNAKYHLQLYPELINTMDTDDCTAIMIAIDNKYLNIVELLIGAKDVDLNLPDGVGWTPLMYASMNNYIEAMELLINAGVNIKLTNDADLDFYDVAGKEAKIWIEKKFPTMKATKRFKL